MNSEIENYYIYVYIDPRNFEEFYYGKGKGSRKEAHLYDDGNSQKAMRIKDIQKAGLTPIIKVIAKELSERDALLIEKTLLWRLGRYLSNVSSGHFEDKFRPHFSMHQNLPGFDYKNGLYFVNVGEGIHRCWDDCRDFGFISAGQGKKYSDPLMSLQPGDLIAAYLKKYGYVGIGRILEKAVPISDFKYNGKTLHHFTLKATEMFENSENEKSEYVAKVRWLKSVDRKDAKSANKSDGIFSSQLIKCALDAQLKTVEYLEKEFQIKFSDLLNN